MSPLPSKFGSLLGRLTRRVCFESLVERSGSVIAVTDQNCYETDSNGQKGGCYTVYAYEYQTGSDGYISWFNDDKLAWTYVRTLQPHPPCPSHALF